MFSLSSLIIPPWVKFILKVLPYVVALGFASGLYVTRATLHEVRTQIKLDKAQSELVAKAKESEWIQRLSAAQTGYTQSLEALSQAKDRSDEDTKKFAATPAGAIHCLDADRVQSILSARADAEAAIAATRGSRSLPSSSDTSIKP